MYILHSVNNDSAEDFDIFETPNNANCAALHQNVAFSQ